MNAETKENQENIQDQDQIEEVEADHTEQENSTSRKILYFLNNLEGEVEEVLLEIEEEVPLGIEEEVPLEIEKEATLETEKEEAHLLV